MIQTAKCSSGASTNPPRVEGGPPLSWDGAKLWRRKRKWRGRRRGEEENEDEDEVGRWSQTPLDLAVASLRSPHSVLARAPLSDRSPDYIKAREPVPGSLCREAPGPALRTTCFKRACLSRSMALQVRWYFQPCSPALWHHLHCIKLCLMVTLLTCQRYIPKKTLMYTNPRRNMILHDMNLHELAACTA